MHTEMSFVRANALALPSPAATFDLALDRGCFHYLSSSQWTSYAAEVRRVLRPGGRLLLRTCLTSRGMRNQVTEAGIIEVFAGWAVDRLTHDDLLGGQAGPQAERAGVRGIHQSVGSRSPAG